MIENAYGYIKETENDLQTHNELDRKLILEKIITVGRLDSGDDLIQLAIVG